MPISLHEHDIVQLLLAVATAANEADVPSDAFATALDRVCRCTGWPLGHVYLVPNPEEAVPTSLWYDGEPGRFDAFRAATEARSCPRGAGLPGRVLAAGHPAWIEDVANDASFFRRAEAAAAGIRSAMAFPVLTGHEVVAVMEFFTTVATTPDDVLLDVMANIGGQLGRVVERERAELRLQASEERFRTLVEEVQDYVIFMLDPDGRVVSWNKGGERIKGYREEEVVGRHFSLFYPPEAVAAGEPERELERARRDGRVEDEGWRLRKGGARFWANVVVTALYDAEGRLQGFSKVTRDLTERRLAEQALHESEARLARAQALAHLGSWEWDVATGELRWSDEMYRVYGFTPGAGITYEQYVDCIPPEDREASRRVVEVAMQTHEPFVFHHRIVRASDGAERILRGEGEVIVDEQGRVVKMFGTGHDVTEQKQIEEELRARERLLRRAQEIAHFGSWEWNAARDTLRWSDELYRIYGLPPGAPISYERYLAAVHPGDRAEVQRQVQEALGTQRPFAFRERIVRPDGTVRVLNSAGEVLRDADGSLWLYGVCHDVTDALQAEQELRERERLFRLLAENMTDLVSLHESDGRFAYVSPSAAWILGYRPDELVGEALEPFVHPEDAPRVHEEVFDRVRTGEQLVEVTYRMRTRGGSYVWLNSTSKPIPGPEGTRVLCSSRNVSERVRAEQAEARYRTALEARNRELQDFAYVASHDLQEPLRKIRAFSDLIAEDYAGRIDPEGRHYLARIQDAATRMSSLITDLLAFSRVTTKGNPFTAVSLARIAAEVLSDLEVAVKESGGRVEVGALPVVEADPLQMRQLLQNLVANALKFARPGVPPVVRVSARREVRNDLVGSALREVCCLTVEDNGIGFDEKYLDRIFTPFQRLHNREAYKGTGMGLAICRRIAERHGGAITARSHPGQGSTFLVVLPFRQETVDETEPT